MRTQPPSCPEPSPEPVPRRSAVAFILGGTAALATGAVGLAAGFLSNALGRTPVRAWLRVGLAEDLETGSFRRHVLREDREHAWVQLRQPLIVYVRDRYPADPLALLSTCSHLGCSVEWDAESGLFRCPCHGGVYDETGAVVEGPPPRPLTRLEVKIEGELCFVRRPAGDGSEAGAGDEPGEQASS